MSVVLDQVNFASFSWQGCPESLERIELQFNQLASFSWVGEPQFNQLISFSWVGTDVLTVYSDLERKEQRLKAGKKNHLIVDMITHINMVYSDIPVLKKYACRDYYNLFEEFKSFSQ